FEAQAAVRPGDEGDGPIRSFVDHSTPSNEAVRLVVLLPGLRPTRSAAITVPKPCHAVAGCRCPRGIGRARTRATGGVPSSGSRSGLRRAAATAMSGTCSDADENWIPFRAH